MFVHHLPAQPTNSGFIHVCVARCSAVNDQRLLVFHATTEAQQLT